MYPQSSRVGPAPNDLDAQRSLDENVTCHEMAGQATQAECRTMVLTTLLTPPPSSGGWKANNIMGSHEALLAYIIDSSVYVPTCSLN